MKLPEDTLEHVEIDGCILVLYRWSKLTEKTDPRVWENVEFFDKQGSKLWTVNGMEESEYWDSSTDMFVSDAANLQGAAQRDAQVMVNNAKEMTPEHVTVLEKACEGISCKSNNSYDAFLRQQIGE